MRISDDHEARVRLLEAHRQHLTPVLAGLTFLLGVLATQVIGRMF